MGACRRQELYNIQFKDVEVFETTLLIKISKTKTKTDRSFTVTGKYFEHCKNYIELLPTECSNPSFFLNYFAGKCTTQRVGINKFRALGKVIASYLQLTDPELYTGQCFRRTSATLLVDAGGDITALKRHGGWKSTTVAEGYIDDSMTNKIAVSNSILNSIENTKMRALYERVVVLEQRNREQDIVIANISKQLSAFAVAKNKQNQDMLLRYCMGNYVWRIDNFQARLDAMLKDHYKMLYSPGFYTSPNGYRFCVRLNISPQNPLCFALHVHLMKTEYDDCLEWPFNGRISFAMINQYEPELSQRDTMMSNSSLIAFRKPTTEICVRGFGYTEYAVVSNVVKNGFVKEDCLIVRVHIKCV